MKTTITAQISSDSLGDGWTDNNAAAHALAEFAKATWEKEIEKMVNEIDIDINVLENTSGGGYGPFVDVEVPLSSMNEIWDAFCESEAAAELWNKRRII